jgi:hypothetical protein
VKRVGFIGENEGKIFESGTPGEVKGSEKEGLRNSALDCKVLGMKEKQWEKAKTLYLAGKSWKAISDETGIVQSTLQSKASRDDWTKFRKGMRDIVSTKETQSLESLSALVRSKLAADAASTLERIDSYSLDGIKDESTREQILGSVAKRSALVFGWSETGEQASVSINLLGSMPDRMPMEIEVKESETK